MEKCTNGKIIFETESQAREEMLQVHSKYSSSGVRGIYLCDICGFYHFTSKGDTDDILRKAESIAKINKQIESRYWEDKLKR